MGQVNGWVRLIRRGKRAGEEGSAGGFTYLGSGQIADVDFCSFAL